MDTVLPACLNCGTPIVAKPIAETLNSRGTYAIETTWRVCSCGAFCRSRRVIRTAAAQPRSAVGA